MGLVPRRLDLWCKKLSLKEKINLIVSQGLCWATTLRLSLKEKINFGCSSMLLLHQ